MALDDQDVAPEFPCLDDEFVRAALFKEASADQRQREGSHNREDKRGGNSNRSRRRLQALVVSGLVLIAGLYVLKVPPFKAAHPVYTDGFRAADTSGPAKSGPGTTTLPSLTSTTLAPVADAESAPTTGVVRVVYAVPSDVQPKPGVPAAIRHEVRQVAAWFASQTGGSGPGFADLANLAVPTARLQVTAAVINAAASPVDMILGDMRSVTGAKRGDIVIAYVDARGTGDGCGEGSSDTSSAVLWMPQCNIFPEVTSTFPDGATYLAAHELVHALGGARACAPHATSDGHVNDSPADVIYEGPLDRDWNHITLDAHHDDYFGNVNPSCPSITEHPAWSRKGP